MNATALYPSSTDAPTSAPPYGPAPLIDRRDPAKTCEVHLLRRDESGRCAGCTAQRSR